MSIDTYGLSTEQYEEFFEDNIRFAAKLYLTTCNVLATTHVDFPTIMEIYRDTIYVTSDDCRRYQKANNPEALVENDPFLVSPSREDLMNEIKGLEAKLEALTEYVGNLVTITTAGLEGIATTLDKPVD